MKKIPSYNQMVFLDKLKDQTQIMTGDAEELTGLSKGALGGLLSSLTRNGYLKPLYFIYSHGRKETVYKVIKK